MNYKLQLLLIILLFLCVPTQAMFAHAELIASNPAAGSTLTATPSEIILTFNEPVGADSKIALIDVAFRRTELTVTADGNILTATPPQLDAGTYSIEFDAVSADGHTILGAVQWVIVSDEVVDPKSEWLKWLIGGSVIVLSGIAAAYYVVVKWRIVNSE